MERLFCIETKLASDDQGIVTGIAWRFDQPDRIGDMIEPGALKGAAPLPLLFQHDAADPVGVWTDIAETDTALQLKGRLLVDDVARAREVRALVKAGAVRGISIGFNTKKAIVRPGGGRTIKSAELLEASLVVIPMHAGARITSAKSAIEHIRIAEAISRFNATLKG